MQETEGIMKRGPPEQSGKDSNGFEPQKFQPTVKANNCFIAEDGRNYERPQENTEVDPTLGRQQNFQPTINTNNHFITEDERDNARGIPQQHNCHAINNLQVPNDKRINRNIAEQYSMGRTQRESNLARRPQSGSVTNFYEAQNMIR